MRLEFRGSREEEERGSDFVLGGGEGAVLWVVLLLLDELFWVSPVRHPAHSFKPGLCYKIYLRKNSAFKRQDTYRKDEKNSRCLKNKCLLFFYPTTLYCRQVPYTGTVELEARDTVRNESAHLRRKTPHTNPQPGLRTTVLESRKHFFGSGSGSAEQ
jgi:hypothetical protein